METTTLKNCAYAPCSKEFEPNDPRQKYCCASHRAMDSTLRKVKSDLGEAPPAKLPKAEPEVKRVAIPKPQGMDFSTQYVFNLQEKEIARWEQEFKTQKEKSKKLRDKLEAVEAELRDLKMNNKLAEISKPSGLQGIMENPMMNNIMQHLGPVAAEFIKAKLIQPEMAGAEDPYTAWLAQQPEEVQNALRGLIGEVMKLNDPVKVTEVFTRFANQLKEGGPAFEVDQQKPRFYGL